MKEFNINVMEQTKAALSLEDKDIWIVGGAGYLGQATVNLMLQAGAIVLCIDIEDRAEKFVNSLPAGSKISALSLNTRDIEKSKAEIQRMLSERGTPDGLVDLSFASTGKSFDEITAEDFGGIVKDGLTSTFVLSREVANAMKQKKSGSMVLFSSMYGSVSPDPRVYEAPMNVNPIAYGVEKAGIVQMTRYLAVYYGKDNIRCNCISPGPFPSPEQQQKERDFTGRLENKVPMGRVGRQHEIAGAVVFFLSDAASYITGQNLFVDGGWTAW